MSFEELSYMCKMALNPVFPDQLEISLFRGKLNDKK